MKHIEEGIDNCHICQHTLYTYKTPLPTYKSTQFPTLHLHPKHTGRNYTMCESINTTWTYIV